MNSAFPYSSYMMSGGCKGSIRPWGNLLHPSPGDDQGHSEAYDLPHLSETPHFSKSTLSGRYIPLGATLFVDYTWVALFTSALSAVFILNSCSDVDFQPRTQVYRLVSTFSVPCCHNQLHRKTEGQWRRVPERGE